MTLGNLYWMIVVITVIIELFVWIVWELYMKGVDQCRK